MKTSVYLNLLTAIGFRRLAGSFIAIFGFVWLLIEPATLFFPGRLEIGWLGYVLLASVSLIASIVLHRPRRSISKALSSPNSVVEIKVGDLFDELGHLVIGTNDVFDTELGEVIKPSSIQGQFLARIYRNDCARLDADVEAALIPYERKRQRESHKPLGKSWRYPIGTTIALGPLESRYFLTAYGHMGNDLKCTSDADSIWLSLSRLWEEVRLTGQGIQVATPILGSDLARTGLPRTALVWMIIISFIVASKREFVSTKLTVLIHPKDLKFVNLYDLEEFLASTCF
jgi:hypothetical protein